MRRAIELAERGIGETNPNPPVGCVLVRNGRVVGEGFHAAPAGRTPRPSPSPWRERGAKGATAYVTLEPCAPNAGEAHAALRASTDRGGCEESRVRRSRLQPEGARGVASGCCGRRESKSTRACALAETRPADPAFQRRHAERAAVRHPQGRA